MLLVTPIDSCDQKFQISTIEFTTDFTSSPITAGKRNLRSGVVL